MNATCVIPIGSMTLSMQAARVLNRAGMPASTKKITSGTGRGCSYGVNVPCGREDQALSILANAGIFPER